MWHVVFPTRGLLGTTLGLVKWRLPNRGEIYEHQMTVCIPANRGGRCDSWAAAYADRLIGTQATQTAQTTLFSAAMESQGEGATIVGDESFCQKRWVCGLDGCSHPGSHGGKDIRVPLH